MINSRFITAVVLFACLMVGSSFADVVYGPDATMSTGDWSLGDSRQVLASSYSAGLTEIATGNPGAALSLNMTFQALSGTGWTAQMVYNSTWTYDPSVSGEITSLGLSGDFNSNGGVAIRAGLIQGGTTYWTLTGDAVNSATYTGISYTGLVQSDFVNFVSGSGNPDFSATGGEITFGYFVRRGDSGAGARSFDIGADNVSVSVIPEPATLGLVSMAALGLLGVRRLRM